MDKSESPLDDDPDPAPAPDGFSFCLEHEDGHRFDCRADAPDWEAVLTCEFQRRMTGLLGDALRHHGMSGVEVALLFTDDDALAGLNKTHRNIAEATDVLAFASEDASDDAGFLGDIALAYGVMAEQALAMKIERADHTLHLVLHSLLHLCGHDHKDEDAATMMEKLEIDLLCRHGIANPYEFRDMVS